MYTHFKRHVDTLVNVAQALVRRNQKGLDADGNDLSTSCNCRIHLLLSVYIEYYKFNTVFSFFKMCIHFFDTLCILMYLNTCKCHSLCKLKIFWNYASSFSVRLKTVFSTVQKSEIKCSFYEYRFIVQTQHLKTVFRYNTSILTDTVD
jgi:hypothetical protein